MKDRPLVSITINNYNYGRFLREAIDSALNQTYLHTEVIVVDDGSTDNSREIIASYGDRIVPVLKENGGQASAFNAGFAASRGDIVCLLDSDDIFMPEKVAEVVNVFSARQDIGWCCHALKLVNLDTGTLLKVSPESSSQECDFRLPIKKRGKLAFSHPATSGLCFTRSLLQLILPMPEGSAITVSDNYLKFTAAALSKGFFMDKKLAIQRVHSNNAFTFKNDKQQLGARIHIFTAHWMRIKFPLMAKFSNNLFAVGLSNYWHSGGVETEYREFVKNYLSSVSLPERLQINLRTLYHYLKKTRIQT